MNTRNSYCSLSCRCSALLTSDLYYRTKALLLCNSYKQTQNSHGHALPRALGLNPVRFRVPSMPIGCTGREGCSVHHRSEPVDNTGCLSSDTLSWTQYFGLNSTLHCFDACPLKFLIMFTSKPSNCTAMEGKYCSHL